MDQQTPAVLEVRLITQGLIKVIHWLEGVAEEQVNPVDMQVTLNTVEGEEAVVPLVHI